MRLSRGLLLVEIENNDINNISTVKAKIVDKAEYGVGDIEFGQKILMCRGTGVEYQGKYIIPVSSVIARLDSDE